MRQIGSILDILIPLALGVFMIITARKAFKNDDPQYDKKIRRLKICGYLLVGVCLIRLGFQLFR